MIHPSYSELMNVINSEVEPGEQPPVQSRYSIVIATSKRARQIIDGAPAYVEGKGKGTGFVFDNATADALYNTIGWACATWYDRPKDIASMRKNAMTADFTWSNSAQKYDQVYDWAIGARSLGM